MSINKEFSYNKRISDNLKLADKLFDRGWYQEAAKKYNVCIADLIDIGLINIRKEKTIQDIVNENPDLSEDDSIIALIKNNVDARQIMYGNFKQSYVDGKFLDSCLIAKTLIYQMSLDELEKSRLLQ